MISVWLPENEVNVRATGKVADHRVRNGCGLLCGHHVIELTTYGVAHGRLLGHHTVPKAGMPRWFSIAHSCCHQRMRICLVALMRGATEESA